MTCENLTINDGNIVMKKTPMGVLANFFCAPGTALEGASQRLCEITGEWSGIDSTCRRRSKSVGAIYTR